jgi:hypothetical protein
MLAFGFPLFGLVVWADSVSRVVVVDDVAVVVGAGLDDVNGLVDGMLLLRVVVVGPRFWDVPLVRAVLAFGFPLLWWVVWDVPVWRVVVVDGVAVVVRAGLDEVAGRMDGMLLLRVMVVGARFGGEVVLFLIVRRWLISSSAWLAGLLAGIVLCGTGEYWKMGRWDVGGLNVGGSRVVLEQSQRL